MKKPTIILLGIALFAGISLAAAQSQPPPPPEKKKPRKVWTNEDLSGLGGRINVVGQEPPPPAEAKAAQPAAAAGPGFPWEELDVLYQNRASLEKELPVARAALENINEEYRKTTDPGRIDVVLEARADQEQRIASLEQQLLEINTRIADLEKQTKGRKRPAKVATKPAAPKPAPQAGEPAPAPEPPPPPPPSF